ncbi:hypothetical protein D9X91_01620 [Falsibacillus albus]|uniref:Uncharacterized protein n=1 Tax=Falsibacillus albus TaxID=2478915 RepID=A0A3L7KBZ8_9BACI|nr:hypothetical protein D9X91_01620 [Falsibacillus albus]
MMLAHDVPNLIEHPPHISSLRCRVSHLPLQSTSYDELFFKKTFKNDLHENSLTERKGPSWKQFHDETFSVNLHKLIFWHA